MERTAQRTSLFIVACAEALRELRTVPNGEFYARVMQHMSHEQYQIVIDSLKHAKLIDEKNHVLTWIGPL
jgi:hypothetical protein